MTRFRPLVGVLGRVLILVLPFLGGLAVGHYPAEYAAFCGVT